VPAPIIGGLITFIATQLQVTVWDGEIPRYDTSGNAINPNTVTSPADWPVVKVWMREPGFTREWTTEDPYWDKGEIHIQCWGITRDQLENPVTGILTKIEALLAQCSNWPLIALGGPNDNPYYVALLELRQWYCGQEEGTRTADSMLLYRGDLIYDCGIHGAIITA